MSKKEEMTPVYWNDPKSRFAGNKFGGDVTEYFSGKDDKRLKKFIDDGKISIEKPKSFEQAKESELFQLRKTVKEKDGEIEGLKAELEKRGSEKLREARTKIKDLEKQIEELTKPGGN